MPGKIAQSEISTNVHLVQNFICANFHKKQKLHKVNFFDVGASHLLEPSLKLMLTL